MTREDILKAALALSADDRAVLLDHLLESMTHPMEPDIEQAWAEEIERRIAAYDHGEVDAIDAEEVLRRQRGRKSA